MVTQNGQTSQTADGSRAWSNPPQELSIKNFATSRHQRCIWVWSFTTWWSTLVIVTAVVRQLAALSACVDTTHHWQGPPFISLTQLASMLRVASLNQLYMPRSSACRTTTTVT